MTPPRNAAPDLATLAAMHCKAGASKLTPDPIHSAFYDSHPPAALRVARLQSLAANPA